MERNIIDVNDSGFKEHVVEKSKKTPVLVDFWAGWCMPCQMLKPVLEKVAKEYDGKFILAKINVDENQKVASHFGVMSIPSVKLFKEGKVVSEFTGMIPEPQIKEWLNKKLK